MGSPAGLCVAVAPGSPRCSDCTLLQPCCDAVCPIRSAGAPGWTLVGFGSSSHVSPAESGRRELSDDCKVQHYCGSGGVCPRMGPLHLLCCSCKTSPGALFICFISVNISFNDVKLCALLSWCTRGSWCCATLLTSFVSWVPKRQRRRASHCSVLVICCPVESMER